MAQWNGNVTLIRLTLFINVHVIAEKKRLDLTEIITTGGNLGPNILREQLCGG